MIHKIAYLLTSFLVFLKDIYCNRALIKTLTQRDIKARYLGSVLGLIWAFVHPTITIAVMWFVFQFGLKSPPVVEFPFSLWLITGMIPWFFFSEALGSATYAVLDYSFLVKNVSVRLSILPIVKILSAFIIHVFLVALMLVAYVCYGIIPDFYSLQLLYYIFAGIVLLMGLSWISASLILFVKDVGQAVTIILQLGFWFTPIIWNINLVPPDYRWLVKFNPVLYLIEGFRDSLIYKVPFWDHPYMTTYFWCVTTLAFCFGAILFKRLRPHFADVL